MRENPSTDNEILENFIKSPRFKDIIKSILPKFEGVEGTRGNSEESFLKLLDGTDLSEEEIDELKNLFGNNDKSGLLRDFLIATLEDNDYLVLGLDLEEKEKNLIKDWDGKNEIIELLKSLKFAIANKIKVYLLNLLKKIRLDSIINSTKSNIEKTFGDYGVIPFYTSRYYSLYESQSGKIYLASNNNVKFKTQEIPRDRVFLYGDNYLCIFDENKIISLKSGTNIGRYVSNNHFSLKLNVGIKEVYLDIRPLQDFIPMKKAS